MCSILHTDLIFLLIWLPIIIVFTVFSAQKAIVLAIKEDGSFVEEVKFTNEQEVIVILDRTCFYAEKGGQVCEQLNMVFIIRRVACNQPAY